MQFVKQQTRGLLSESFALGQSPEGSHEITGVKVF